MLVGVVFWLTTCYSLRCRLLQWSYLGRRGLFSHRSTQIDAPGKKYFVDWYTRKLAMIMTCARMTSYNVRNVPSEAIGWFSGSSPGTYTTTVCSSEKPERPFHAAIDK